MADIEFIKPTKELVEMIAEDMRPEDVAEVWASDHNTPLESLMGGWRMSNFATVAAVEGVPLAMFGLVKRDILSGSGIIWMLGSNEAKKYRREFLTLTPPVIDEMLAICPRLCNMVHTKNRASVRWLKWLGFTIEEPEVHGPDQELFHRFHIERP